MIDSKKVFLDTALFIYYLEHNKYYFYKSKNIFIDCYKNQRIMITSAATVEEYCIYPYKNNRQDCIAAFDNFIAGMEIIICDINVKIAKKAAQIRAEYKDFKAMDALQLATACISGCDLFLTNDKQLKQFKEMKCIIVDEWE